mmetsp:Transcript_53314/g.152824  ORF Transcript_53314/g.152824 Transcript_53314/m.152824 type:complete len:687 (-) Transcript_53314:67-2127(-)
MQQTRSRRRPPAAMRGLAALALLLLPVAACGGGISASVTPVQKVIELLTGMLERGKEEKHKEEVAYSSFAEFCRITTEEKGKAIEKAASDIVALEAQISAAEAAAAELGEDVEKLDAELNGIASEKAKATALRKKESDDFQAEFKDFSESVDALERAISVLKSRDVTVTSLLDLRRHLGLPQKAEQALRALLSTEEQGSTSAHQAPKADAYEFQSDSIVGMLEKLRLNFQDEREKMQKEEMNRKHSFELVSQGFHDDAEEATKTRAEKAALRGEKTAEAEEAKGTLVETTASEAADETYLRDLTANCDLKGREFQERQTLRAGEIEAIGKAIEIISSPDVSGHADKYLPAAALLQRPARSLAQLRGEASHPNMQKRLQSLLSQRAKQFDSSLLLALATHASNDPFQKVTQMIKDLLVRLMESANSEADHHEWCTDELKKNKQSRDDLSTEVEILSANADELSALEQQLATEGKELSDMIAELDAAVNTATENRQAEKALNTQTIADSKAAQTAVTQATQVLKKFYAAASEATALLQRRQSPMEDGPGTWDESYKGMHGESGGVFGMLEVIASDFSRLETETTVAEQEADQKYKQFMEDFAVDRAVKDKEMRHKGYKRDSTLRIERETKKDLGGSQEMLDEALAYYDKLKPSCIDTGLSYEDRVLKRKEEIQSLKEALRILGGEDLP